MAQAPLSQPGLPLYFEHYTGQEYGGLPQNWAVTQDPGGLIFVGNRNGVLIYDGVTWEVVGISNLSTVRSLSAGTDGRVYVGAQGQFGYVSATGDGTFRYSSISDRLGADGADFVDDVWGTHVASDRVFFQTRSAIFVWDGQRHVVIRAEGTFRTSFLVGDTFFVRDRGRGLMRLDGDELVLVAGGERFSETQVFTMLPLPDEEILIGSREEGLFRLGRQGLVPFRSELDDWLRSNRLYSGAEVGDHYVLGTLGGGIAIMRGDGSVVQILDEESGLPDGWVNHVFTDRQGGVWLALHNRGLVRLNVLSALTVYDERHGLSGLINLISRDGDGLRVLSGGGQFRLRTSRSARSAEQYFTRLPQGDIGYAHVEASSYTLTGTNSGIHVRFVTGESEMIEVGEAYTIDRVTNRDTFYSATAERGLIRVTVDPATKTVRYETVPGLSDRYSWVVVDRKDRVWAVSRTRALLRVEFRGDSAYDVTQFAAADGIPSGDFGLVRYGNDIAVASSDAILRFVGDDVEGPKFIPDERFARSVPGPLRDIRALIEDETGRIWLVRSNRVDILTDDGEGGFHVESPLELSFPTWNTTQVFVDRDGIAWLSNDTRLYRYDPRVRTNKTYAADVPPVIRRITLIESGMRLDARTPATVTASGLPQITHNENAIRFEFALPSFNDPDGNQYQFMLEGHDANWSDWSLVNNKSYTNLREGRYRFRVRGRNAQGMLSPEAFYTFRVLPPWYRTTWAYIGYLLLVSIFVAFVIQYRRMVIVHRRAQRQAEELERERSVNERLQESYARLQEANESLLQADKLKDEFLANTSHELRTPLTAILGFASILKDEVDGDHREFMGMIEENGKRLLHTLNSLLDLAKLRVGMMDTNMQPVDVVGRAHDLAKLMMPLARKKGIELDVRTPSSAVFALLDEHCTERILYNLVGNAIKFTDKGSVSVIVEEDIDDVLITVRDTGIGIDELFLPELFNEFRQESAGLTREHEGSGLGLAITNRLVMLMNGSISVTSKKGSGSTFSVRFPLYRKVERATPRPVEAETVTD